MQVSWFEEVGPAYALEASSGDKEGDPGHVLKSFEATVLNEKISETEVSL